jgi:hypothetical protein
VLVCCLWSVSNAWPGGLIYKQAKSRLALLPFPKVRGRSCLMPQSSGLAGSLGPGERSALIGRRAQARGSLKWALCVFAPISPPSKHQENLK